MTISAQSSQVQLSRASIKGGSKTFRLASLVLDSKSQSGAYLLYRWCRHCDDQIDGASSPNESALALEHLYAETRSGLVGRSNDMNSAFYPLYTLASNFNIPENYYFDLLEGFAKDVNGIKVDTLDDLLSYCYHVAGVVGLMMSHILGARNLEVAKRNADSLGRAMQLTNISRDIAEDFRLGRIYLPTSWLLHEGVAPENLLALNQQEKLFKVVTRILAIADELYAEGRKGLAYLPFRAAWSISIASYLYQGIGLEIKRQGPAALSVRMVLSPLLKLKYIFLGTFYFMKTRFKNWSSRLFERSVEL